MVTTHEITNRLNKLSNVKGDRSKVRFSVDAKTGNIIRHVNTGHDVWVKSHFLLVNKVAREIKLSSKTIVFHKEKFNNIDSFKKLVREILQFFISINANEKVLDHLRGICDLDPIYQTSTTDDSSVKHDLTDETVVFIRVNHIGSEEALLTIYDKLNSEEVVNTVIEGVKLACTESKSTLKTKAIKSIRNTYQCVQFSEASERSRFFIASSLSHIADQKYTELRLTGEEVFKFLIKTLGDIAYKNNLVYFEM